MKTSLKAITCLTILLLTLYCPAINGQEIIKDMEDASYLFPNENLEEGLFGFNLFDLDGRLINLNDCTSDELRQIGLLTEIQIHQIILYRKELGAFLDIHELQAVPKIDASLAKNLSNYLFVPLENNFMKIKSKIKVKSTTEILSRFRRTLEKQRGFDKEERKYEGDPNSFLLKIKHKRSNDIQLSFIAEKDPGESFFKSSNPWGFDYYAGQLIMKNVTAWLNSVYLGDFRLNLGQGLLAYNGFNGGKGKEVLNIMNYSRLFSPHSSSMESAYLRGLGVETSFQNIGISIFASSNKVDANLDTLAPLSMEDAILIRSIQYSGLHRTLNEIENERKVRCNMLGGRLIYNQKRSSFALNWLLKSYPFPLVKDPKMYSRTFSGLSTFSHFSFDHRINFKNIYLAGEFALGPSKSFAYIEKAQISLSRKFDISFIYRNYAPEFSSSLGNAFGEASKNANEEGLYFSMLYLINYNMRLSAYIDLWRNKWLSFSVDSPSFGRQYLLHFNMKKKRVYDLNLSYIFKVSERTSTQEVNTFLKEIENFVSQKFRIQIEYNMNPFIKCRNRIEIHHTKGKGISNGFMFYHDILFKPFASPFSFTARYAVFDIKEYDSRIYAYENDLVNNFSVPAYASKGSRFYINASYKINRHIRLESRVSRSYYPEDLEISSGNDKISGNSKTEIKIQMRVKF